VRLVLQEIVGGVVLRGRLRMRDGESLLTARAFALFASVFRLDFQDATAGT
jgi:hypothetical protein